MQKSKFIMRKRVMTVVLTGFVLATGISYPTKAQPAATADKAADLTGVTVTSAKSLPGTEDKRKVVKQNEISNQQANKKEFSYRGINKQRLNNNETNNQNFSSAANEAGPGRAAVSTEQVAEHDESPVSQLSLGEQVVSYATQFLGNPYVYGGTSLTNGADCSGFVMKVYQQFGISLPRTSRDQGRAGIDVGGLENARPGDVVSYKGHIGIYMGQNQLVHASNPEEGIKISPVNYKPILSIRRFVLHN